MKRMTYFVMALALALGFTQCKKEQLPDNNQTEGVLITLDVNGGNSNSKVIVDPTGNPNYATVTFEDDDIIYVGYNGAFVGTLTYGGEVGAKKFSGSVDIDSYDGEKPLHFYFLGGKGFTPTIDGNTATVNISDQTEKYPVISFAPSKQPFTGAGHYSAKLQNKCSIMKFNVTTPSSSPICITGMNNQVSVNFASPSGTDNGFSYDKATTEGVIKMRGGSGTDVEKWAIVLQQDAYTTPGAEGTAYTEDGFYEGTRPAIPEITMNQYINEDRTMAVSTPTPDGPLFTPLTLEALTNGTIEVTSPQSGMQYSKNGEAKTTMSSNTIINVVAGDKVAFYGNGTSIINYFGTEIKNGTAQVKVYGNIMSLVNEINYATATTVGNTAFRQLFRNNTTITDAKDLILPATTIAQESYSYMFEGCSSLTTPPVILATTLNARSCFSGMFKNCTGLTSVPEMHVTQLSNYCYQNMFYGCTNLTIVSSDYLPVTTLTSGCYEYMFQNCSKLTSAPNLLATKLSERCYQKMFNGCSHLNSVTCLATDISASNCTTDWLNGVAATGTFTKAASMISWTTGASGIPSDWTVVNAQ